MALTRQDVIYEGLERLCHIGFTMDQHFSEHGPMVVDVLLARTAPLS